MSAQPKPLHHGLTQFGEAVVHEMQRIGMLVDVSHVSDETFDGVMRVAQAPVIASHSSARALCDVSRNLTDDQLRAVGRNGGVVMVNFYPGYIDPAFLAAQRAFRAKHAKELDELGKKELKPRERREAYEKLGAADLPKTPLAIVVDHIEHVAKIAGVDHVGLGSDFDGVSALPQGLEGIDGLPAITLELVRRGWADEDVKKALGENFLRVFSQAEAYARATSTELSGQGSTEKLEKAEKK
jgi:membrane dipeptidase